MKTALVLGASGEIGRACALSLLKDGFCVTAHYHTNVITPQDFHPYTDRVKIISGDLASADCVQSLAPHFDTDALVHAAGISQFSLLQETSLKDFQNIMDVNFASAFLAAKLAAQKMIVRGGGKMLFISSIWGNIGGACESVYSAAKSALNGFVRAISKELAPSNICVNAIAAGLIDTKMNARLSLEELKAFKDTIPLGRLGTPNDVANLASFLVGQNSNYITGQIIGLNGGLD